MQVAIAAPRQRRGRREDDADAWVAFVAFFFMGLGLGLFFGQVAVGILVGMGTGFLAVSLLNRRQYSSAQVDPVGRKEKARELAEVRYWFRWHLAIYVLVNLGLVLLWYFLGGGFPWPLFPIAFWPVGLVAHYWLAYRLPRSGWIERETEKILAEGDESKRETHS